MRRILLPVLDERFQSDIDQVKELILSEVNVKEIEYITDTAGMVSKKAKANFKSLGKRLGKNMKVAAEIIQSLDQDAIAKFEQGGTLTISVEGEDYALEREDIEVISEDIPGWQVAFEDGITVALDVTLDDDLISEGTARELVNRIQNLRKSSGLNVTDRIHVKVEALEGIEAAIQKFGEYIRTETLALSLETGSTGGNRVEWMDGEEIGISIER